MDFARKNWIVLAVVAVVSFLILRRSGFAMGAGAGGVANDLLENTVRGARGFAKGAGAGGVAYVPPGGGTAIPGTLPVGSASLALTHEISAGYAGDQNIPYGAAMNPSSAARTGKGHF